MDLVDDIVAWGILALGIAAAFGYRAAYVLFVAIGVLFMPVRAGFDFSPQPCEMAPSVSLALHSLKNYNHIVLFAFFTLMTRAQFARDDPKRLIKVAALVLAMGAVVELEQALVGRGHCRIRDLIPDAAGFCIGAGVAALWGRFRGTKGDAEGPRVGRPKRRSTSDMSGSRNQRSVRLPE